MSGIVEHAKLELQAVGYNLDDQEEGPNKWIVKNILELLEMFSAQGHSGSSASYCIEVFSKLASFEPLAPLTGEDDEWEDVSEMCERPTWQNKRCTHVFKDGTGKAYDVSGRIFSGPDGITYTSSNNSSVPVTFPYSPVTEYVDVPASDDE